MHDFIYLTGLFCNRLILIQFICKLKNTRKTRIQNKLWKHVPTEVTLSKSLDKNAIPTYIVCIYPKYQYGYSPHISPYTSD